MKKRLLAVLGALLVVIGPVWAVFKEDNLNHTLSVLLMELKETYSGLLQFQGSVDQRIKEQHQRLVDLVDECNELSVMLYSQASENTFDLTFALNEVTSQYEQFKSQSTPYAEVKEIITTEMDRYNRLVLTLRKMPPERTASDIVQDDLVAVALDSAAQVLALPDTAIVETPDFVKDEFNLEMDEATTQVRDSCLYVAEQIVAYYWLQLQQIQKDNEYYEQTDELLRSAYDYAQEQYVKVQRKLFVEGQGNYFKTLRRLPRSLSTAREDLRSRYSLNLNRQENGVESSWRGPIVFFYSFMLLFILGLATLIATFLVNWAVRKSGAAQLGWVKEHKGLLIALLGLFFFGIFLFINAATNPNTFIVRSSNLMAEFALLIAAIFTSMLIRLDKRQIHCTLNAYRPTVIMAFIIIYLRSIFIPNSVIRLVFPALLLIFTVWQYWVNVKMLSGVAREDRNLLWSSAAVLTVATLISWAGVVMGSLMLMIAWMFLLSMLETVTAISELVDRYYEQTIKKRKSEYRLKHPDMPLTAPKGAYIEVTWLHDLLKMTVLPVLTIWCFPVGIFLACNVFNFTKVAEDIFTTPFINGESLQLSLSMIIFVVSLFYLFRYIVYAAKSFYRTIKTQDAIRKLGADVAFKETDINFNLADNIFSLAGWGIYIIIVFLMLKIPASGLALVSTGLATGLGFAMKDILNNFFYGIQLMGGRVRVGDTVECDGTRGTVVNLSYQTTQIEAVDGSIMFFPNATLFNKNFKNLTRNNSYQLVSFQVGVKYGTDVEEARQIILEAIKPLMGKDKYGREVVDKRRGIIVRVINFGDSSVDLQILLHTTVETYASFPAQAREAIYRAFAEKGIEIPFPQLDVHVKDTPQQHA